MLPPSVMLTIKNRGGRGPVGGRETNAWIPSNVGMLVLALALLAGCTPTGPRALLEGKRLVDEGMYPQAIQTLKTATTLLGGTNALAWNYLGVAYQQNGDLAEAERAYAKALQLDRGLDEVRFNLGCLWLAENKLEAAKVEFTACTMRQPNAVEGFLKLGAVQLRTHEPAAADKTFNDALRISPQNPEALNGLGLARLQRGRATEAAQAFDSALKQQPNYGPALLNLAIVSHQYLKDRQLALEKYREYLVLKPTPPNTDVLAATVRQLEQELNPPVRHAATNAVAQPSPSVTSPKPAVTNVTRIANAPKSEQVAATPRPVVTNVPRPAPVVVAPAPVHAEVVKVAPQPILKPAQDVPPGPAPALGSPEEPLITTSSVPASAAGPKVAQRSFLQRVNPLNLFRSGDKSPAKPTPLGPVASSSEGGPAKPAVSATESAASHPQPPVPAGPPARYSYKSPAKPAPGNRGDAERLFAQGAQAQQAHRLPEAMQSYRQAIQADPTLFEAQYNLGLAATEVGNLSAALTAYENALAVQPQSLDARYNFALVLKQANYLMDAVNELERVVTMYPNETRSHLVLGNLYAQQFRQPAKARQHYLKVLEVEPRHPQAAAIRFWLAANPP
jgi:tetratricopeptide (TPR) repeat protein